MQINRNTYEELFLLYNDGELSLEEQKAVEDFVRENPDLEQELILLQGAVFTPDEGIVFEDKESLYRHERKVVPFPWYRLAAAAVVLFALTTIGWLFLDNKEDAMQQQPMASKKLVKDELQNVDEVQQVKPTITTVSEQTPSPADNLGKMNKENVSVVLTVNKTSVKNIRQTPSDNRAPASKLNEGLPKQTEPDHADVSHDIVVSPREKEVIDVAVTPVEIEREPVYSTALQEQTVQYVENEKDDIIYFANTSLPKKSKLRGVFRKATRILDKVTSIQ